MDELPADLRAFLLNHPFLQLTDAKKIKCTLNGHEFPCNLTELQKFTQGKKYEKLSAAADFNYSQYEPHIVPSSKQPNQFFCKLTLRHLNRQPHHVLRHVNGKRFKKALSKYEECVRQGIEYAPARLKQKRPRDSGGEVDRGRASKHGDRVWEPTSSDEDHSDSEDSMSDLYPPTVFTVKNPAEENMEGEKKGDDEEEDDFQTDEDEDMEVDNQVLQKRKKVQGGGFQKKFRNNNWKSGRKKRGKVPNGNYYETKAIFIAMGITGVVCIAVTVFCFQTKVDFTSCGGFLCIAAVLLMIVGIVTAIVLSFQYVPWLHMLYAAIGAIVYTLFLVYNTQLLIGNRELAISPEEYVYGALSLYIDIVHIFLFILQISGAATE